ncbi:hypothetical protein SJAG_16460 [Schizosaccharomyces japonicus yFS275]|uniref:Crossover junction endonuclease MUS81-like HHH domain-containing protein n=1 Tax=Schizosaccharomyces japonicus (strain yFS275 / FY16936) TaxID=402676 RepID=T0RSQ5_SCHJY|nr:hypothetical protein SJAG_16460 [Schizosaccharomyces japonicus yFS275]EQC52955.1 hypothetical protein SJAG_16460 [Schizosaccharomyces japonicus yFS275]
MRNYEITSDSHCYLIINAGFFLDNADNLEGYVLWTTEPNTQKQYNSLIASNINYGDFSLEKYACKRKTPYYAANAEFVDFLSNLKKLRELAGDHDQVTAYMRAIASIKAFPERLQNLGTLKRLPYCGEKIVFLFTLYSRGDYMSELAELRDKKQDN